MALSREEVAARYGIALYDYAHDMNALETVQTEMIELKKAVEANLKIISVFSDPVLDSTEKENILAKVTEGFSAETQNFLAFLLEYQRFENLLDIIAYFEQQCDHEQKIASGTVVTAVELDENQIDHLSTSFAKKYDLSAVRLENKVDSSILGGVILQVGDRMIDGSVKNKLKKIRAQLISKN